MTRFGAMAVGLLLAAGPAMASQPISESMADCAGMLRTVAGYVVDADNHDRLIAVSDRWLEASIEQARTEGAHYPAFFAISMQDAAIEEWESRGVQVAATQDYRDWADYCRALDHEYGLGIYAQ